MHTTARASNQEGTRRLAPPGHRRIQPQPLSRSSSPRSRAEREPTDAPGDPGEPDAGTLRTQPDRTQPERLQPDRTPHNGEAAQLPPDATAPAAPSGSPMGPNRRKESRLARFAFHLLWVLAAPAAASYLAVWALTPGSADRDVGGLRVFVAEQQIPVAILLFIVFVMVVWRARHLLPLAQLAGYAGRADLSGPARELWEDAHALLEEARHILHVHRKDAARSLTSAEREKLDGALADLERAMDAPSGPNGSFDSAALEQALTKAERLVGDHLVRWRKGEMREYAESIAIAVGLALVLRTFVVEAFKIPSGSMIPTLMIGDHIFVNKLSYGPLVPYTNSRLYDRLPPERGDVMVFRFPEKREQDFIKRAIGLPGDQLDFVEGRPIVNGWLVPDCFVGFHSFEGRKVEVHMEHLDDESYFTTHDLPSPRSLAAQVRAAHGLDIDEGTAEAAIATITDGKGADAARGGSATVRGRKDDGSEGEATLRADDLLDAQADRCQTSADCLRISHGYCAEVAGYRGKRCLQGPYRVNPNEVWVLGDNRNNSHDSRAWRGGMGGGVPLENIKGRAMFVWLSFASGGGVASDRLLASVMGRPKLTGPANTALGAQVDRCLQERPALSLTTPPKPR
jgi:signal peptidase I